MSQKTDGHRTNGEGRWDSFSVYADISQEVSTSVYTAIEAHSRLESMHSEGLQIQPQFAALCKSKILSAARELKTEIKHEKERGDEFYTELYTKWHGSDGYLNNLQKISLRDNNPDWLSDLVEGIHEAAWELGYLKAGREDPHVVEITQKDIEQAEKAKKSILEEENEQ